MIEICPVCHGAGWNKFTEDIPIMFIEIPIRRIIPCAYCDGSGKVYREAQDA